MSRHRNIKNLDYDEEYDEAYDDTVYGRSVDDYDHCVSPSTEQYLYKRGQNDFHSCFGYNEGFVEDMEAHLEERVPEKPKLSDEEEARLRSILDQLREYLGTSVSEDEMTAVAIAENFDLEKTLDKLLIRGQPPPPPSVSAKHKTQETKGSVAQAKTPQRPAQQQKQTKANKNKGGSKDSKSWVCPYSYELPESYCQSSAFSFENGKCSRIPVGRYVKDWFRTIRDTRAENERHKYKLETCANKDASLQHGKTNKRQKEESNTAQKLKKSGARREPRIHESNSQPKSVSGTNSGKVEKSGSLIDSARRHMPSKFKAMIDADKNSVSNQDKVPCKSIKNSSCLDKQTKAGIEASCAAKEKPSSSQKLKETLPEIGQLSKASQVIQDDSSDWEYDELDECDEDDDFDENSTRGRSDLLAMSTLVTTANQASGQNMSTASSPLTQNLFAPISSSHSQASAHLSQASNTPSLSSLASAHLSQATNTPSLSFLASAHLSQATNTPSLSSLASAHLSQASNTPGLSSFPSAHRNQICHSASIGATESHLFNQPYSDTAISSGTERRPYCIPAFVGRDSVHTPPTFMGSPASPSIGLPIPSSLKGIGSYSSTDSSPRTGFLMSQHISAQSVMLKNEFGSTPEQFKFIQGNSLETDSILTSSSCRTEMGLMSSSQELESVDDTVTDCSSDALFYNECTSDSEEVSTVDGVIDLRVALSKLLVDPTPLESDSRVDAISHDDLEFEIESSQMCYDAAVHLLQPLSVFGIYIMGRPRSNRSRCFKKLNTVTLQSDIVPFDFSTPLVAAAN